MLETKSIQPQRINFNLFFALKNLTTKSIKNIKQIALSIKLRSFAVSFGKAQNVSTNNAPKTYIVRTKIMMLKYPSFSSISFDFSRFILC
ncbi:hypothetical protein FI146_480025 [Flavobacterium psychrophilum]|nr:hypothetical protein FI146_480025 [Flavobacterium psychrophilum]